MQPEAKSPTPIIEGYFRPAQARRARDYSAPLVILLLILTLAALATRSPLALAGMIAVAAAFLFARSRKREPGRVLARLDGTRFSLSGAGYDIHIEPPFRFKTGIDRKLATETEAESCFVRLVIDAHGKPLVLQEEVLEGYFPPQLDEIVGISSALGIAELTSLRPYPGALWALIEALESRTEANAVSEFESHIESLYRIGQQQLADGEYGDAIASFSGLLRQRPDSAGAYYSRGAARYHARIDLDKAVNDLTTALRLEPDQYRAYRMRGLVRARQDDWAGARDDYSLALQFHPTSAELHSLRGTACYRLQDFAGALASFDEAIRLDESRPDSFYNRGLARHRQGELAEAAEDFERALALNPAFTEARRNLQTVQGQLARSKAKWLP